MTVSTTNADIEDLGYTGEVRCTTNILHDLPILHRKLARGVDGDIWLMGHEDDRDAVFWLRVSRMPMISRLDVVSRLPVGSSANRIDGAPTNARAIATRLLTAAGYAVPSC